MVDKLKRKANANLDGINLWQKSVVVSFTSAQSIALGVKAHSGDNGQVYLIIIGKRFALGFKNIVSSNG